MRCADTLQLICAFVFTFAHNRFSHDAAQIIHKGLTWNRKHVLVGAKQPGCMVSVLSDTSSDHVHR